MLRRPNSHNERGAVRVHHLSPPSSSASGRSPAFPRISFTPYYEWTATVGSSLLVSTKSTARHTTRDRQHALGAPFAFSLPASTFVGQVDHYCPNQLSIASLCSGVEPSRIRQTNHEQNRSTVSDPQGKPHCNHHHYHLHRHHAKYKRHKAHDF